MKKAAMIILILLLIPGSITLGKEIVSRIELTPNKDFVYLGTYTERKDIEDDNLVLIEYEDYKELFDSNILTKEDFKKYNYAVIEDLNNCDKQSITPYRYSINNYNISVIINYKKSCGYCENKYSYYLLKVDKDLTEANLSIYYDAVTKERCG